MQQDAVRNVPGQAAVPTRTASKRDAFRQALARRRLEERREQLLLKQQLYDIFAESAD